MGEVSMIAWTHATFNPWRGCEKVSPACLHCYAETWAKRTGKGIWGKDADREIGTESYWRQPTRWDKEAATAGVRRRVFCSSLADVFEDRRDLDPHRARLWGIIEATPNLDWLLLTKRPSCIRTMLPEHWLTKPRPNVWLGTTCENQRRADERIPHLLAVPAAVRFVSVEPLLGPIEFKAQGYLGGFEWTGSGDVPRRGLDWVIVGGESGPGARKTEPDWFRGIREQCRKAAVAFFFKQKGKLLAQEWGCKDRAGADPAEWPAEFRIQELPTVR